VSAGAAYSRACFAEMVPPLSRDDRGRVHLALMPKAISLPICPDYPPLSTFRYRDYDNSLNAGSVYFFFLPGPSLLSSQSSRARRRTCSRSSRGCCCRIFSHASRPALRSSSGSRDELAALF